MIYVLNMISVCYVGERKLKMMITLILIFVITLVAGEATTTGTTEKVYTQMINAIYGTNHTGRPRECGRDWTYFHYIATETAIVLILQVLNGIFSVVTFIKWRNKQKSSLVL